MHELGIAKSLMSVVLEKAKEKKGESISKIVVVVGTLAGVTADALRFGFETVISETIAEDAELIIEEVQAMAYCAGCKTSMGVGKYDLLCPKCEGILEIKSGRELYVKEFEIE